MWVYSFAAEANRPNEPVMVYLTVLTFALIAQRAFAFSSEPFKL
jgi:hypothetical protein